MPSKSRVPVPQSPPLPCPILDTPKWADVVVPVRLCTMLRSIVNHLLVRALCRQYVHHLP